MPDKNSAAAAKDTAKARRASAVERMANLAAAPAPDPDATAERSARSQRATADRKRRAPATTARTVRAAAMPAEARKPDKIAFYPARISHTTTYDQLDALEELKRHYQRTSKTGHAISITALLRAATAICLDNAQLRERMARDADLYWSETNRPR